MRLKKAGFARSHYRTTDQDQAAQCPPHNTSRNFLYVRKLCWSDRVFVIADLLLLTALLTVILYPLLYVVASSFSGGYMLQGLSLIPKKPTLAGYRAVFQDTSIWRGYLNTILYTGLGTAMAMVVTILCAYPLSRGEFRFGQVAMALCVFTMYFGGGLIPTYLWEKQLGLLNTMWSFLLPATLNVHNMIVMRTYFETQIPTEIRESTEIDGCGEWRYLTQFVLPLSGSVLAVIALYYAVARWNSYFDAMIYLTDKAKLPLQNILREILIVNSVSNDVSDAAAEAAAQTRAELLKYAVIVVATLPMMLVYPFVQKFFVQGVMLGSVKG